MDSITISFATEIQLPNEIGIFEIYFNNGQDENSGEKVSDSTRHYLFWVYGIKS